MPIRSELEFRQCRKLRPQACFPARGGSSVFGAPGGRMVGRSATWGSLDSDLLPQVPAFQGPGSPHRPGPVPSGDSGCSPCGAGPGPKSRGVLEALRRPRAWSGSNGGTLAVAPAKTAVFAFRGWEDGEHLTPRAKGLLRAFKSRTHGNALPNDFAPSWRVNNRPVVYVRTPGPRAECKVIRYLGPRASISYNGFYMAEKKKDEVITFRSTPELTKALVRAARKERITVSELIRRILKANLRNRTLFTEDG